MKIKIVNCNNPMLWYYKHKGEVFEVVRQDPEYYWCLERTLAYRCLNIIPKQDDIEVSEFTE